MRINLVSPFGSNDPFGDRGTSAVEIPDHPITPVRGFKFAPEDRLLPSTALPSPALQPFDDGPSSTPMRFEKFTLAPAQRADHDALGGNAPSGGAFKLASVATGDELFNAFGPSAPASDGTFRKGADGESGFHKFARFTKVQETADGNVLVWGIATLEQPDLDSEICDYDAAKEAYQAWSVAAVSRTSAAGQQVSLGPIRYQHSTEPAGKATKIQYDDDAREIWLGSIPINDEIKQLLQDGFLTGYSQGGSYAWRKCTDCNKSLTLQQANNYCPNCKKTVPVRFGLKRLSEVSYVDSPCTGKGFDYVKSDGSSRFVSFNKRTDRTSSDAPQVMSTRSITKRVFESIVSVGGRRRALLHGEWLDGEPFQVFV